MKWMKSILCSLVCLAFLGACSTPEPAEPSVTPAVESPAEEAVSSEEENRAEPEEGAFSGTLTIVHINDVHGHAQESETGIGYAKTAAFIEEMKQVNPNTIALDAGDTLQGSPLVLFDLGESIVPVLNTLGLDAMTAGNADFMLGSDALLARKEQLSYPMLTANMGLEDGQAFLDSHTVLTLDSGLTVGVIGLTTPVSQTQPNYVYQDAVEAAAPLVDELRPKVDVLVGLVHLGDAEGDMSSDKLAEEITGFDVLIDGHSHTVLENGKEVNGTLIAQAGEYNQYIGVVDLMFEDGVLAGAAARLVSKAELTDAVEKEDTAQRMQEIVEKSDEYFSQPIGETLVALDGNRENIRVQETNMGNLYADAMREKSGADIAIAASALVGGEIAPGPITQGDLLTIVRVDQQVYAYEISGEKIVELLNVQLTNYPEPDGMFSQVSGMQFKIDPETNTVYDVVINDQPIEWQQTYSVAITDVMLMHAALEGSEPIDNYGDVKEAIIEYITAHSPISLEAEGRITVTAP